MSRLGHRDLFGLVARLASEAHETFDMTNGHKQVVFANDVGLGYPKGQ